MGWEEKQVCGYSEFMETAQRYHGRPIFALFCGDKDAAGQSWCPDCVTGGARGGAAEGREVWGSGERARPSAEGPRCLRRRAFGRREQLPVRSGHTHPAPAGGTVPGDGRPPPVRIGRTGHLPLKGSAQQRLDANLGSSSCQGRGCPWGVPSGSRRAAPRQRLPSPEHPGSCPSAAPRGLPGDSSQSWKDPNNEFRKNLKLTGVPTLLKYGTPQKLVEEECFKAELVRMLFTED